MGRPALLYFDECETGYDNHMADPAQDVLIRSMPIVTFRSILESDLFAGRLDPPKWGRIVYACDAPVAARVCKPRAPAGGGCPYVEIFYAADTDKIPGFEWDGGTRRELGDFMAKHGLEQSGDAHASHVLPIKGVSTRVFTCLGGLPVGG